MPTPAANEPIRQAVIVPVPADEAFGAFIDLTRWWPPEYTWSADTLEAIGIELEHRAFTRHGQAGGEYRQAMASPQGWPLLLDRYAAMFAL